MPLKKGYGKKSIKTNITTLRHEGRPEEQAVAIALDIARRNRRKHHK